MAPPLTFGTGSVLALCVALWLLPALTGTSGAVIGATCMAPRLLARLQVWRLFGAFVHAGFFHILFNMIAWYFLGMDYERKHGSLVLLWDLILRIIPAATVVHFCAAYLLDAVFRSNFKSECAVGLSGALFALLVEQLRASGQESVSVFGFFDMSARWYPPALALVLQLFSPGLSLLGHFGGIGAGHLLRHPILGWSALPYSWHEDLEYRFKNLPKWSPAPGMLSFISREEVPTFGSTLTNARNNVAQWWATRSGSGGTAQPVSGQPRAGTVFNERASTPQSGGATKVFSGAGHKVGGSTSRTSRDITRTGVPPHSRLLAQQSPRPPPRVARENIEESGTNSGVEETSS